MGTLIDKRSQPNREPEAKRERKRKHYQRYHAMGAIDANDAERFAKAVDTVSERYVFELLNPVPGQEGIPFKGTYTARGANLDDIRKHVFTSNSVEPLALKLDVKAGKVERLCSCTTKTNDHCTDDHEYWP